MVEIFVQVPLTKNPESITWNLESVESRIQDCLGFPYMVQAINSNDHWVFSKMVDHPVAHSQVLPTLQDGM